MELSRININLFLKTSYGKVSFFLYMFLEVRIDFQAGLQLGIKRMNLKSYLNTQLKIRAIFVYLCMKQLICDYCFV